MLIYFFYDYYKCVGEPDSQGWSTWLPTKKTNRCCIDVHSHFNHTLTAIASPTGGMWEHINNLTK